jgi:hypothetical protein
MYYGIRFPDKHPDPVRWSSPSFHHYYLVIFITADIPGKMLKEEISFPLLAESMDILTGIL